MNNKFLLIFILVLFSTHLFSQINTNNTCEKALPFCTGTSYSFPAGTGTQSAQSGPCYNCLSLTPNPAWYYMKIKTAGTIQITMHSEPAQDIDFCCWGPFDSQAACNILTCNRVIDCSYSTNYTEVVDIPNAAIGKYYVLVITNYSNSPCNIIFSQTGGSGVTDCSILPPAATSNSPLCVGGTLQLHAAPMNGALYHWTGPGGWSSSMQNPTRPNVTLAMAGIYNMFVTINGVPSSDTNHTMVVISSPPTSNLSGDAMVCAGDSVPLTITSVGQPPWQVTYMANGIDSVTVNVPSSPYQVYVKPDETTLYEIAEVSNAACTGTGTGSALIVVLETPLVDFSYNHHCSGKPIQFEDNTTINGGNAASWLWSFGMPNSTANVQNPSFTYNTPGTYTISLTVSSTNGCSATTTKTIEILPSPTANAGANQSINYGTPAQLSGSASGGSGNYSYHWEPASLLVNPNVLNPTTVSLSGTTDFTLFVEDANGCSEQSTTTVTVVGGPLMATITADPPALCLGDNSQIQVLTGGGSGSYTYSWSSNPPGFSSSMEDITVQPIVTTTYILDVSDGFATRQYSVTVLVHQPPAANAGQDRTINNGTNTALNGFASGGTSPYTYSWTPAEYVVSATTAATNTVLLDQTRTFHLQVKDAHGCVGSDEVVITIVGGALSINPFAEKSPICSGESTTLHAAAGGGSGNYTFNWTSADGFHSIQADPLVAPITTMEYFLTINDGFNTRNSQVLVQVNPLPEIHLPPAGSHVVAHDTMYACVFDTVTLSAYSDNCQYLWANGATTSTIYSATSGIAFDVLKYKVEVGSSTTGCTNTDSLTIMFTYAECSYGVSNEPMGELIIVPNPGKGIFACRFPTGIVPLWWKVHDAGGREILKGIPIDGKEALIDIQSQPAGVYLLQLATQTGVHYTQLVKLQ